LVAGDEIIDIFKREKESTHPPQPKRLM